MNTFNSITMVLIHNLIYLTVCAHLFTAWGDEHCNLVVDIVFLIDDSSSISSADYKKEKEFVQNVIGRIGVGENKTRVGVAKFSANYNFLFNLGYYNNISKIQKIIADTEQTYGSTTDTHLALDFARKQLDYNGRKDAYQMVVLITDGESQQKNPTFELANQIKNKGIAIVVIAVGNFSKKQLHKVASTPLEDYFFSVDNFQALNLVIDKVANKTCEVSAEQAKQRCYTKPFQVVFVLDASTSIAKNDFLLQLNFTVDVIDLFNIGVNKTRIAAVSYSNGAAVEFGFDKFSSAREVKDRIVKVKHTLGDTYTDLALTKVRQEVLLPSRGFSFNSTTVVIVITDGHSQRTEATKRVAAALKNSTVHMIAIGVGSEINHEELKNIGSLPSDKYVFEVKNFDALNKIKNVIAFLTCST